MVYTHRHIDKPSDKQTQTDRHTYTDTYTDSHIKYNLKLSKQQRNGSPWAHFCKLADLDSCRYVLTNMIHKPGVKAVDQSNFLLSLQSRKFKNIN